MPTAYHVSLRPTTDLPLHHVPRKLHGLACRLLEGGTDVDHDGQCKPFSVWPLLREQGGQLCWRLNWLGDDRDHPRLLASRLGSAARLGSAGLEVTGARPEPRTFADLARLAPFWRCDFTFLAPTYFSRSGRDYPLPDPELLLGQLARRWNDHAPDDRLRIDEATTRALQARAILVAHDISTLRTGAHCATAIRQRRPLVVEYETAATPSPPSPEERAGFVGVARIGLKGRHEPVLAHLFARLCAYAEFCGVGKGTPHGFGAVMTQPVHG